MTAEAVDTNSPSVAFHGFGLAFPKSSGDVDILVDANLSVPAGGLYLLVGESGSGKSTILKLLTDLWDVREPLPRMRGRVDVLGEPIRGRYPPTLRGRVQAVLQDEGLLDELSPRRNVELALDRAGRSRKLALALLSQAGLEHPPQSIAELSGGMRKRLAVARALAGEPDLLIFDEPTAGLDADSARDIAGLIARTQRESGARRTTLVITHDLPAFRGQNDGILWLDVATKSVSLLAPDTEVQRRTAETGSGRAPESDFDADLNFHGLRRILLAFAALASTAWQSLVHFAPRYPLIVARTLGRYVVEPAFFVVIGCATVGGLATFFALRNNPLEGAFEGSVITGAGKVLVAVLIPLLAGFFFTARIAAGAAARLGTMKRTNQVAALRVMGIHPADYLLTPLVWATSLAMPIATLCGLVMTCVSSCGAAMLVAGVSPFGWAKSFFAEVDAADLRYVLLKTVLAGYLVAVQTYHLAMGPKRSGREVGQSVNSAIVLGIYTVLLVHAVLTLIQFG